MLNLFDRTETKVRHVVALPVDHVHPDPQQPRKLFRQEALDALAASIQKEGLLQPIAVRPDPDMPGLYRIIGGERRWRATKLAGLPTIACEVHTIDEGTARRLALLENLNREDLNVLEEAEGVRQLLDLGYSYEEIGQGIGKKAATLEYEQKLLALDPSVQDLVRQGHLARAIALKLTKLSTDGQVNALKVIGGKDAEAAGAVIDALVAKETQRDLFAEALAEVHGNKVLAIARRWERFSDAARCLVKSLISPEDFRLVPAALRVDIGRKLAELEVTIKSLERIRREMQKFYLQRGGVRSMQRIA